MNTYFKTDYTIHEIKSSLVSASVLLSKLVSDNPNLGNKYYQILLDIDKKTFECIIETLRNGKEYKIPICELDYVSKFISNDIILPKQSDFVKVDLNGIIFYTTIKTLSKLTYFSSYIELANSSMDSVININRSGKSFRHVLKYLRNPNYIIPKKYLYEDYFYGIFDKFNKCDNIWSTETPINNHQFLDVAEHNKTVDKELVGNPQITFHKLVHRPHTLFTRTNKQVIGNHVTPNVITYNIDIGNILNRMFVHIVPLNPELDIADLQIEKVELVTDDNFIIDTNSWDFIQMHLDLFAPELKKNHLTYLEKNELYLPLFFNLNNVGVGLPIRAIENKIKLRVVLKNNIGNKYRSRLVYKYNDVTGEERRKFIQTTEIVHKYLYQCPIDLTVKFNNYVSEIILPFSGANKWIIFKIDSDSNYNTYHNNLLLQADLYVNDKFYMQTDPLISMEDFLSGTGGKIKFDTDLTNYYVMPFCVNMLEHQPSGTLMINDTDQLKLCIRTACQSGSIYVVSMQYTMRYISDGKIDINPIIKKPVINNGWHPFPGLRRMENDNEDEFIRRAENNPLISDDDTPNYEDDFIHRVENNPLISDDDIPNYEDEFHLS